MGPETVTAGRWRNLRWLWLSALIVVFDQLTKLWALDALSYQVPVPVFPGLNWTLVYNLGGAFSLFSDGGGWQLFFFLTVASIISVVLLIWLWREPAGRWLPRPPIAMILGGAIGNVIDRIRYGHVVDFIDVYISDSIPHWPTFNIADSGITVGVAMLIWYELFGAKSKGSAAGSSRQES